VRARIRQALWRRILLGASAAAVYAVAAYASAVFIPASGWPAIGDGRYSAQAATMVPAMNVIAVAALGLAIVAPVAPRWLQIACGLLAAVVAAAAGPLLAFVETGADVAILTPGVGVLAVAGAAIVLTCGWAAERTVRPAVEPEPPR
jgi:hypothetical protein